MYVVLGGGVAAKVVLYFLCISLRHRSDSMAALAEDHANDVASNIGAIVAAVVAVHVHGVRSLLPL